MRCDRLVRHRPRRCEGCGVGAQRLAACLPLLARLTLRSQNADLPNLLEPHRMVPLEGVNIVFIAAGAAACHRCARRTAA